MFGLDGLKIGGGGGGTGYTDCCARARSIATHAPKTHAHPATKNFADSIRIAISFEPMFIALGSRWPAAADRRRCRQERLARHRSRCFVETRDLAFFTRRRTQEAQQPRTERAFFGPPIGIGGH